MPRCLVLPDRYVAGWSTLHPAVDLEEMLTTEHATDAHFACYYVPGEDQIPRLVKGSRARVREMGGDIVCDVLAVDVDAPKDADMQPWRDQQAELVEEHAWIDDAATYDTLGGYRLVWTIDPLAPAAFERRVVGVIAELRRLGIPADEACSDWTRLYRCPGAPRYRGFSARPGARMLRFSPPPIPPKGDAPASPFGDLGETRTPFVLPETVEEGDDGPGRNVTLLRLAGKLRAAGMGADAVLAAVRAENDRICRPPLVDAELLHLVGYVAEKPVGVDLRAAVEAHDAGEPTTDAGPRILHDSEVRLCSIVLEDMEGDGEPLAFDAGRMWRYSPAGVWESVPDHLGHRAVMGLDEEPVLGAMRADGSRKIVPLKVSHRMCDAVWRLARSRRARPGFFDGGQRGVAFCNGFLSWSGELVEHSPEHRVRHRLAFDYVKGASAPRFVSALEQWLSPLGDDAGAVGELLAEFAGACLFGAATDYQRALVLYGLLASNGKSQFVEIVSALFPAGMIAAVPPQRMDDQPARAKLAGVRINVVSELPEAEILRSEGFKAFVGGDRVEARQVYREGFDYRPIAGHLFAANRLPLVRDTTEGFWRRWLVVPFRRRFTTASPGFEPDLARRVIDEELQGVAAWAVAGARRLRRRGGYAPPGACVQALEDWRHSADRVAAFVLECCEDVSDREDWSSSAVLHRAFDTWAFENGGKKISQRLFGLRIQELGFTEELEKRERRRGGVFFPLRRKGLAKNLPEH